MGAFAVPLPVTFSVLYQIKAESTGTYETMLRSHIICSNTLFMTFNK
jgi:hypothetical protein